jgi:TM2 domain-containing membrane protein YozV
MPEQNPLPNWLKPLPVRIGAVVLPVLWSGFEFYTGQAVWGFLFLAVGGWGLYTLILKPPPGT